MSSPIAADSGHKTGTAATDLPNGVRLAAVERVLESTSLMFSLAHFFVSTRMVLTSERLVLGRPNSLFGLIPFGSETLSSSLRGIASVGTSTKIQFRPLALGALLLVVGVLNLPNAWPAVLAGLYLVAGACQAAFRVVDEDGGSVDTEISILDKGKAQALANRITASLEAGRGSRSRVLPRGSAA